MSTQKIVSQKLKITDYVFKFKDEDLNNVTLDYYFDNLKYFDVDREIKESTTVNFYLSGNDDFNNVFIFDFTLNLDLKTLNKLDCKITKINDYIIDDKVFFFNPYADETIHLYCNFEEDIYRDTPNFWVLKQDKNFFTFKVSFPEDYIFIWFNVDFN